MEIIKNTLSLTEKLNILADAENMMLHAHPAVLTAGGKRDFLEIPALPASATAFPQMDGVFPF